ncbi:hypothetical protein SAMN06269301_3221 [Geobacter sp. DSM 9736]|nr:hypothetical protein SAMN06269301_3221 [Geobacter sp. DSM 9736]
MTRQRPRRLRRRTQGTSRKPPTEQRRQRSNMALPIMIKCSQRAQNHHQPFSNVRFEMMTRQRPRRLRRRTQGTSRKPPTEQRRQRSNMALPIMIKCSQRAQNHHQPFSNVRFEMMTRQRPRRLRRRTQGTSRKPPTEQRRQRSNVALPQLEAHVLVDHQHSQVSAPRPAVDDGGNAADAVGRIAVAAETCSGTWCLEVEAPGIRG